MTNLQSILGQLYSKNFIANKINESLKELNEIKYNILNDNNNVNNLELDNDISQIFILFNKNMDAFKFVLEKRLVGPNYGFMEQLKLFEQELIKNNYDLDKIKFNEIKWKKGIINL